MNTEGWHVEIWEYQVGGQAAALQFLAGYWPVLIKFLSSS